MVELSILDLFDNMDIVSATIAVDEIDSKTNISGGQLVTRNALKITAKHGDVAADIVYVLDDKVTLDEAIVSTRYNSKLRGVNPTAGDHHRSLADINLNGVFDNIKENHEYIQEWFDWLKRHSAVIPICFITLASVEHYEGLLEQPTSL